MLPIALTDIQLREVQQAAQMVPWALRRVYLERLAGELRGKNDLGDGEIPRLAYKIAREIAWNVERTAAIG
jgi:hypothetical protein